MYACDGYVKSLWNTNSMIFWRNDHDFAETVWYSGNHGFMTNVSTEMVGFKLIQ